MEHGHRPRSEGDDERRIFEKEAANPFRGMDDEFHRRRQNSWLDEYERDFELDDYHHQYRYLETEPVNETKQEEDGMAHSVIETFSQFLTPTPHG